MRTRLRLQSGRIERSEEEIIEPEDLRVSHQTKRSLSSELYLFSAKQRSGLFMSLGEEFGKETLQELSLSKDAMKSLMTEAIEVTSVSLSALGNPFFSDATLTGTVTLKFQDFPGNCSLQASFGRSAANSRAAAKRQVLVLWSFQSRQSVSSASLAGPAWFLQSDIEEFVEKIANIAQPRDADTETDIKFRPPTMTSSRHTPHHHDKLGADNIPACPLPRLQ